MLELEIFRGNWVKIERYRKMSRWIVNLSSMMSPEGCPKPWRLVPRPTKKRRFVFSSLRFNKWRNPIGGLTPSVASYFVFERGKQEAFDSNISLKTWYFSKERFFCWPHRCHWYRQLLYSLQCKDTWQHRWKTQTSLKCCLGDLYLDCGIRIWSEGGWLCLARWHQKGLLSEQKFQDKVPFFAEQSWVLQESLFVFYWSEAVTRELESCSEEFLLKSYLYLNNSELREERTFAFVLKLWQLWGFERFTGMITSLDSRMCQEIHLQLGLWNQIVFGRLGTREMFWT